MSTPSLLGLYQPGSSWLHRLSAGYKLIGLLILSVVVVLTRGPWSALILLALVVALGCWAAVRPATVLRSLRGFLIVAVLLGSYQTWQRGWPTAVEVVADLLTLILAALLFTMTTPIDDVLTTVTRALQPLRRVGVNTERVSLAFTLMLRAVPHTLTLAQQTREAAKARGLEWSPRATLIPFVLRVVGSAHETGEALDARGLGD